MLGPEKKCEMPHAGIEVSKARSQEHRVWFTAAQRQPDEIFVQAAACFSNFVLLCRKKEKAGNNRSPVLNDSRVLSRHQFHFPPPLRYPLFFRPGCLPPLLAFAYFAQTTATHALSESFCSVGGSDGSSIVAGGAERSAKEVRGMLIRILWFIDGTSDREGRQQGEEGCWFGVPVR